MTRDRVVVDVVELDEEACIAQEKVAHGIEAVAAVNDVVADRSIERILAVAAVNAVVAFPSLEQIVAALAADEVTSAAAEDGVIAGPGSDDEIEGGESRSGPGGLVEAQS